jgi:uncharacterized protein YoxC
MTTIRPSSIYGMCKLFCEASIESDLAKRVMLSIVPSVQSEGEKFQTGGFDYKALRSAASGAKALIKYGAKACANEAKHASVPENPNDVNGEILEHRILLKSKQLIDRNINSEDYVSALRMCIDIFKKGSYFATQYGGKPWENISRVLLDLALKDRQLDATRQNAIYNREEGIDYLSIEISIMKEMIVIMNHFDGLAHNTASVMYSVVEEELKDLKYPKPEVRYDSMLSAPIYVPKKNTTPEQQKIEKEIHDKKIKDVTYPREYMKRIEHIMDAKELDNPFDAFKQVKNIIEEGPNKYLFQDYIRRIKEHPKYNEPSQVSIEDQYKVIRFKKTFLAFKERLESAIKSIIRSIEKIASSPTMTPFDKAQIVYNIDSQSNDILLRCSEIIEDVDSKFDTIDGKYGNLKINNIVDKLSELNKCVHALLVMSNTYRMQSKIHNTSEVDLNNQAHRLRKEINELITMVAEL